MHYIERFGVGTQGSRLVCGNLRSFMQLEERIADLCQSEAALLFCSGYQANVSLLPALTSRTGTIFIDRHAHRSLVDGSRLSRAKIVRFAHNDLEHLEKRLASDRGAGQAVIVTESVFSMHGDLAPLRQLERIALKHKALLVVDEAHAVGVFGSHGFGILEEVGPHVVKVGTFSKAGGGSGAFIACSKELKDLLVNFASGLIYSTAMPPPVLGAIDAACELIPVLGRQRTELLSLAWKYFEHPSQIIPVHIGSAAKAVEISKQLKKMGFLVVPIRPPTVPEGHSILRLSLSKRISEKNIKKYLNYFNSVYNCN